ncbi:hypothetical protein BGZ54_008310 [Gamsiella multidivaricata]|nr:hypothetical protein BGZ54_008310 [Gamsiella multidivaricata]
MSPMYKSLAAALAMILSLFQISSAAPCVGSMCSGQDGLTGADLSAVVGTPGFGSGDLAMNSMTNVPVAPISIVPETDFFPLNNVQPVVNVLPTAVNDFSGWGDSDAYGLYGSSGLGMAGLGFPGAGLAGLTASGVLMGGISGLDRTGLAGPMVGLGIPGAGMGVLGVGATGLGVAGADLPGFGPGVFGAGSVTGAPSSVVDWEPWELWFKACLAREPGESRLHSSVLCRV